MGVAKVAQGKDVEMHEIMAGSKGQLLIGQISEASGGANRFLVKAIVSFHTSEEPCNLLVHSVVSELRRSDFPMVRPR